MNRAMTAVVAAAVAGAGVAGCSSSGAPASTSAAGSPSAAIAQSIAPGSSRLSWHRCPQVRIGAPLPGHMQCASLQVPLNYADPSGRKITLALSEIPATAPASQRQGALLVNPGGPGASGLSLAATVAAGLTPSVARQYN